MQISFVVGVSEQHVVEYSWDQFWGRLTITVDGWSVIDTVRMFSFGLVKTYEFTVGVNEPHHVRIDKHRERFFAGFRPQPIHAYVDGVLVASTETPPAGIAGPGA